MSDNVEAKARLVVKQFAGWADAMKALDTMLGASSDLGKIVAAKQVRVDELTRREAELSDVVNAGKAEADKLVMYGQSKADKIIAGANEYADNAKAAASKAKGVADKIIADAMAGIAAAERESAAKLDAMSKDHAAVAADIDRMKGLLDTAKAELTGMNQRKADVEAEINNLRRRLAG